MRSDAPRCSPAARRPWRAAGAAGSGARGIAWKGMPLRNNRVRRRSSHPPGLRKPTGLSHSAGSVYGVRCRIASSVAQSRSARDPARVAMEPRAPSGPVLSTPLALHVRHALNRRGLSTAVEALSQETIPRAFAPGPGGPPALDLPAPSSRDVRPSSPAAPGSKMRRGRRGPASAGKRGRDAGAVPAVRVRPMPYRFRSLPSARATRCS